MNKKIKLFNVNLSQLIIEIFKEFFTSLMAKPIDALMYCSWLTILAFTARTKESHVFNPHN